MASRLVLAWMLVAVGCRGSCGGPPAVDRARGARIVSPGSEGNGGAPVDGGTIRIHVEAEPATLNPLVEHDVWTMWIGLGAIYDPLVRQDPATGSFSPGLADSWAAEGDRSLRFHLRDGVSWHDGAPLTIADVIFTFDRLHEPGAAPDLRADLGDLDSVQPAGEREVRMTFGRPAPLALQALARVPILPAHRFAPGDLRPQEASRAPVGTGPFRFVEWRAGERIVLERAPGYAGPRPHVDRVELRIVRDREAALELFRRGELDLLCQLTPAQVDRALVDEHLASARIVPVELPRYQFIVWNQRRPGLGDRRVRQALTLLTDRQRYLRLAYRGRARSMSGPFLPGSPSSDPRLRDWAFDPARAAALLDQAGIRDHDGDGIRELDGAPFRVAVLQSPPDSPVLAPLFTMMQEDFRRAGVLLDIVPVEWAGFLPRLRAHAFDAASLMWNDLKPAQDNWPFFHSSQAAGGQNYGGWKSLEADRLLDALRATPMGPERIELERAFHRLVHEELPYTFVGSPEVDSLVAPQVHGYVPDAAGPGFSRLWLSGGSRSR